MGKLQFIFSGKAHPNDWPGKEMIKKIFSISEGLCDNIKVVYLENYDIESAKMLVGGVDVWLNTPRKPKEASGTSGMKAAHNGIPSFSILDGWWIEGCIEGLTGWSIGSVEEAESIDEKDAGSLYEKLEKVITPIFYNDRQKWIDMGQSLNLYLAQPNGRLLSEMYIDAWKKGLKTTYYLRSLAATQVEKSTLDVNRRGIQPRWMKNASASSKIQIQRLNGEATRSQSACSILDPECEACQ